MNQIFATCRLLSIALVTASLGLLTAGAQDAGEQELRDGQTFIETPVYSAEEDEALLKEFTGLRVADVADGMDAVGLAHVGRVSAEIGPLWKDTDTYAHRVVGVAVTARYVPTQQPVTGPLPEEEFDRWVGQWYEERSPEPFVPLLREGSALVIEDAPLADVGSIGSNNILGWKERGCVGVITTATARDTDEIIAQKVPLYLKHAGRGIRPGRNEIESVNRPIVCGGALVVPGDVVVADGDGVLIVPREHAVRVARYAHKILEEDKAGRRRMYERLGMPLDESVR